MIARRMQIPWAVSERTREIHHADVQCLASSVFVGRVDPCVTKTRRCGLPRLSRHGNAPSLARSAQDG
jgi:hypothetical protein